jgi:ERCC4-related helicase
VTPGILPAWTQRRGLNLHLAGYALSEINTIFVYPGGLRKAIISPSDILFLSQRQGEKQQFLDLFLALYYKRVAQHRRPITQTTQIADRI